MSTWEGFTDDELRGLNRAQMSVSNSQSERASYKRKNVRKIEKFSQIQKIDKDVSVKQGLCSQNQNGIFEHDERIKKFRAKSNTDFESDISSTEIGLSNEIGNLGGADINPMHPGNKDSENNDFLLDESSILEKEMQNLEKFREVQKEVEELNKKKKAMLTSAILEKEKRANAETRKLLQIKRELCQLDLLVVSDINIIRDKIEEASRSYLTAQKRYESAEKEFIEAKIDLQKKQECKEELTEHLCTVIHQNEMRKAAKLNELMNKLEIKEKGLIGNAIESIHAIPSVMILEQPQRFKPNASVSVDLQSNDVKHVNCKILNNVQEASKNTTSLKSTVSSDVIVESCKVSQL